jgi:hypothetical protein
VDGGWTTSDDDENEWRQESKRDELEWVVQAPLGSKPTKFFGLFLGFGPRG